LRGAIAQSACGGLAMTIATPVPSDSQFKAALQSDGPGGRPGTSDRAIVIALPTDWSEEAILSCTNFQILVDG